MIVERKPAGTIDITPTWRAVLPVYLAAHENGNFTGRKIALEELNRMAKLADEFVAQSFKAMG